MLSVRDIQYHIMIVAITEFPVGPHFWDDGKCTNGNMTSVDSANPGGGGANRHEMKLLRSKRFKSSRNSMVTTSGGRSSRSSLVRERGDDGKIPFGMKMA